MCLDHKDHKVQIYQKKPQIGQSHQYQVLGTIPQEVLDSIPIIYIGMDRNLKNQLPGARNSLLGVLLKEINEDFERQNNLIKVMDKEGKEVEISRLERFNQCIQWAIETLKTDEFIALEKSIKTNALLQLGFDLENGENKFDIFFNPLTSLEFYKSLELWVTENGFSINATQVGSGFQNAIVIAILKAFEERRKQGAIFIIEEPEMFLHPQMQRSLYKTLRKIGETNQVIYTTHSAHFITIPNFDEILIFRKDNSGTNITISKIIPDEALREKFMKELNPERNEMFFAKRLMIVEGDTEKLALPEYANRMGFDIDREGTTIIEVGGKRNLESFIDLALSFEMEVGFVYDTDSSDIQNEEEERVLNMKLEEYSLNGVEVWRFDPNYEGELKKYYGEEMYQKICQKYGGYSKPIRARLIACDEEIDIPAFITSIVKWLSNKEEKLII